MCAICRFFKRMKAHLVEWDEQRMLARFQTGDRVTIHDPNKMWTGRAHGMTGVLYHSRDIQIADRYSDDRTLCLLKRDYYYNVVYVKVDDLEDQNYGGCTVVHVSLIKHAEGPW